MLWYSALGGTHVRSSLCVCARLVHCPSTFLHWKHMQFAKCCRDHCFIQKSTSCLLMTTNQTVRSPLSYLHRPGTGEGREGRGEGKREGRREGRGKSQTSGILALMSPYINRKTFLVTDSGPSPCSGQITVSP